MEYLQSLDDDTRKFIAPLLDRLNLTTLDMTMENKNPLKGKFESKGLAYHLNVDMSKYRPEELPIVTAIVAYLSKKMTLLSWVTTSMISVKEFNEEQKQADERFEKVMLYIRKRMSNV